MDDPENLDNEEQEEEQEEDQEQEEQEEEENDDDDELEKESKNQEGINSDDDEVLNEDEDEDDEDEDDEDDEDKQDKIAKEFNDGNKKLTPGENILGKIDYDLDNDFDESDSIEIFNDELKEDYILKFHPECKINNFEEIKKLLEVSRNKDYIIIDKMHKTLPFLTKYEKTKILGLRIKQLNNGAKPFIEINDNLLDNYIIAEKELYEKKLPFIVERPIHNYNEYWKLKDLEIL